MTQEPLISICIPTYERVDNLKNLLHNIRAQTFKNYEIIITDNSLTDEVEQFVLTCIDLPISYSRNVPTLSMGENWNKCMKLARGKWLKMMHDDDYFTTKDALSEFALVAQESAPAFIFARLTIYDSIQNKQSVYPLSKNQLNRLRRRPEDLIGMGNIIGNPCNTLIHRDVFVEFTPWLKWIVDFEGYIKMLKLFPSIMYIDKSLVTICHHPRQLTQDVFLNREVEIPENNYLSREYYPTNVMYFFSYDYFWRKIRNLNIRAANDYCLYIDINDINVPKFVMSIIQFQAYLPQLLLKIPFISKLFSFILWCRERIVIKKTEY